MMAGMQIPPSHLRQVILQGQVFIVQHVDWESV